MTEFLERIATALERIADRLDALTLEPETAPESPTCPHPEDLRMPLGGTNGWICQACQHVESPS